MPRHYRHRCHPTILSAEQAQELFAGTEFVLLAFGENVALPRLAVVPRAKALDQKPQYIVQAPETAVELVQRRGLVVARCNRLANLYHLVWDPEAKERRRMEREIRLAQERERFGLV